MNEIHELLGRLFLWYRKILLYKQVFSDTDISEVNTYLCGELYGFVFVVGMLLGCSYISPADILVLMGCLWVSCVVKCQSFGSVV